jgi:VWFA-related protein
MRRFRTVALALLLTLPLLGQEFRDEITVERVIIDAHVIEYSGEPLRNLSASDFRVLIDGQVAEVESVEFVEAGSPYPYGSPEAIAAGEAELSASRRSAPPPEGRLIIFFFQTDFGRMRTKGIMRITSFALKFLDSLHPQDRVAVVSFDSQLRLRQDFTNDRRKLEQAIKDCVKIGPPRREPEIVHSPSLFARIPKDSARRATSSEQALLLVGNALLPVPGPKTMVLYGWGLGVNTAFGVTMTRDYRPARRALESSRTSVFVMDISDADWHSLEVGLQKAAADTGGFYARTHIFPSIGMNKLERAISGHYILVVRRPPGLKRGLHQIEVTVPGRRGIEVLARRSYMDR